MAFAIRQFQDGDAETLWNVFFSAVRVTAARDYSPEQVAAWAPANPNLSQWTERMRGISPFVAEREGRIVGYADVQPDGYIDHFFVAADANRQGVGSALMRSIHETAQLRRTPKLFSHVSLTARPFFEHWGFKVDAHQTVTVRGVELHNMRMSKDLGLSIETRPTSQ